MWVVILILHILSINSDSYNLVFKLFMNCFGVCVCVYLHAHARHRQDTPRPPSMRVSHSDILTPLRILSNTLFISSVLDTVFGRVRNSKLSSWSVRSVNPPAGSCSEHTCSAWARCYHGAEIRRWNRWVDLISFHICCGQWCLPILACCGLFFLLSFGLLYVGVDRYATGPFFLKGNV